MSAYAAEPAGNVEAVRDLVKHALEAEAAGNNAERQSLLEQASQAGPTEPAVHWQQGKVRSGDSWKTYEAISTDGKNSKVLQAYREQRDASEPTAASQRALALYCERNKLPAQAEVHWSAVLELEPENVDARKHLKFERYRDRWLKQHDIAAERAQANRVAGELRRLTPVLNGLVSQLAAGTLTVEKATEQLLKSRRSSCHSSLGIARFDQEQRRGAGRGKSRGHDETTRSGVLPRPACAVVRIRRSAF